jgi:hypothetical protein
MTLALVWHSALSARFSDRQILANPAIAATLILPLRAWHLKLIRTPLVDYSRSTARLFARFASPRPSVAVTFDGPMVYASYTRRNELASKRRRSGWKA